MPWLASLGSGCPCGATFASSVASSVASTGVVPIVSSTTPGDKSLTRPLRSGRRPPGLCNRYASTSPRKLLTMAGGERLAAWRRAPGVAFQADDNSEPFEKSSPNRANSAIAEQRIDRVMASGLPERGRAGQKQLRQGAPRWPAWRSVTAAALMVSAVGFIGSGHGWPSSQRKPRFRPLSLVWALKGIRFP